MSWFEQLKEILSHDKKPKPKSKHKLSELERRLIMLGVALVMVAIAIAIVVQGAAVHSTALSSCKSIIFTADRYDCYATLAYKTSNASLCGLIGTSKGSTSCVMAIAENTKNVTTCSKISSSSDQYAYCIENVSSSDNDAGYCTMLNSSTESVCAYSIAKKENFNELSECSIISNVSLRNQCDYIYDYSSANLLKQTSYCALLPNVTNSTLFSTIISKGGTSNSTENVSYLAYYSLNITPRSFCYYRLAYSLKNASYCGYTNGELNEACISSVNQTNSTASNYTLNLTNINSLCSSEAIYAQGVCKYGLYTDLAISGKNVSICMQLSNSSYQYSCIGNLAAKYNDSSYCNYISGNVSAQQACVEDAGATLNTSS